ncbi:MAG: hypothetical protein AAGF27_00395 [Pseudomonadota bacterium]
MILSADRVVCCPAVYQWEDGQTARPTCAEWTGRNVAFSKALAVLNKPASVYLTKKHLDPKRGGLER